MNVRDFINEHYRHFNAASLKDAAKGYNAHLQSNGKMFVTLAGAMSTAELGLSLAEMIRKDKVHGISCTGANLEEDVFNLVANKIYKRIPNYRDLTPEQEHELYLQGYNRVTDTCIPEQEAFRVLEKLLLDEWKRANDNNTSFFPHEYFYNILLSGKLKDNYQIDPKDSWLLAAAEKGIPVIVPGWEDSTCGNFFAAGIIRNEVSKNVLKTGIDYMVYLAEWYRNTDSENTGVGFFQIGGGIAGDFPICAVPMMIQDLEWENIPFWSYFCQISDSTTSYGSYSGAVPNEKISWGKLNIETPKFIIESDASIVAPLMFAYILDM